MWGFGTIAEAISQGAERAEKGGCFGFDFKLQGQHWMGCVWYQAWKSCTSGLDVGGESSTIWTPERCWTLWKECFSSGEPLDSNWGMRNIRLERSCRQLWLASWSQKCIVILWWEGLGACWIRTDVRLNANKARGRNDNKKSTLYFGSGRLPLSIPSTRALEKFLKERKWRIWNFLRLRCPVSVVLWKIYQGKRSCWIFCIPPKLSQKSAIMYSVPPATRQTLGAKQLWFLHQHLWHPMPPPSHLATLALKALRGTRFIWKRDHFDGI